MPSPTSDSNDSESYGFQFSPTETTSSNDNMSTADEAVKNGLPLQEAVTSSHPIPPIYSEEDDDDNFDEYYNDIPTETTFINDLEKDNNKFELNLNSKMVTKDELASNRTAASAQLSQWTYNNNRKTLDRSILQIIELLDFIKEENESRPIHIPEDDPKTIKLNVLNLQVKLDGNFDTNNNIELSKEALAILFTTQLKRSINHLKSLQRRVNDVSSKVFITGDVNTGKSNFCNSLLKKKLLPEDQLPCTNVFCEILEPKKNQCIEEVHAIRCDVANTVKDAFLKYDITDSSNYEVLHLDKLHDLVLLSENSALLRICIKDDTRPAEQSL
ncbi:hypothetical protein Kpol_1074p5 [Vanderwaltozyma polyspora DSM 70294]|uniref:Dynamin-type G domain-containing protein n=1 Tax=Vanderwaltozyma polyspora (strain ATCC 22028 / DSM 70294 / BCRC 21397 / CBS 2163 / NBRC 10782 / NRRL Y-8283 / UCD 57-17) TaxID=436907 RepID=A7TTQ9_VANPO|nr:uncharacterized protein Kpol_1074p5 [Vanderwaltozyma polyspora DSM 70294]EDO14352.1 hypothetical protein Kpol_1074p5 [Vanderwaltozyma polyspora DSM 70294]